MVPSLVLRSQALAVIVAWLMLTAIFQGSVSTTAPSPSSKSTLEPIFSSHASVTATTESRPTPTPAPSPPVDLDHNATNVTNSTMCSTGPVIEEASSLLLTGFVYLDIENPVPCAGTIVNWDFCYYVIGFRNSSAEMWPGVWRRGNDSNYHLIGQNRVSIIPDRDEDNSTARCRDGVVPNSGNFIKVEEGDLIGFYLPDNGIFIAKSSSAPDPGTYQYRRNDIGYTDLLQDSEMITVGDFGRALVKATIDPDATLITIAKFTTILPHPVPSVSPTQTTDIEMSADPELPVALIGGMSAAAGGTILILLLIILCLVAVVVRKRAKSLLEFGDSMEYNGMYNPSNQAQVVIGGRQTVLDIGGNPAYVDNTTLGDCTSERQLIEHTYESLSNLSIHTVRHIGVTQNA